MSTKSKSKTGNIAELQTQFTELKKEWAVKLGIEEAEIDTTFNEKFADEKKKHPKLSKDAMIKAAMRRTYIMYKKKLTAPGRVFSVIPLYAGNAFDTMTKRRRLAFESYEKNGDSAEQTEMNLEGQFKIFYSDDDLFQDPKGQKQFAKYKELGKVEEVPSDDGDDTIEKVIVPVDNRQTFKSGKDNKYYGKPLALNSYMRTIFGIGIHTEASGKPGLRPITITLNDKLAQAEPPTLNLPYKVTLRWSPDKDVDIGEVPDEYQTSGASTTKWTLDKEAQEKINIEDVIRKYSSDYYRELIDLDEYHDEHADAMGRNYKLVITEGDVHSMQLDPQEGMSRSLILDDITLGFGDEDHTNRGIRCWLGDNVVIDFGEESRVIATGGTNRGKGRDPITGDESDEYKGDISLNIGGIYALPEYRTEFEAEDVSEEDYFDEADGDEDTDDDHEF